MSKSKPISLVEQYELAVSYENLLTMHYKYESEMEKRRAFRESIERLRYIDRELDFKFYKQFSLEADDDEQKKTSSGDPKINSDNGDNKDGNDDKKDDGSKKKFLDMAKSKAKEFKRKIIQFFGKLMMMIASKSIKNKTEATMKLLDEGKDLDGLKDDRVPANQLSAAMLTAWSSSFLYAVILKNTENYNNLNNDNELGACAEAMKNIGKTFEEFHKKIPGLKGVKTPDEFKAKVNELRNITKDLTTDGNSKNAIGDNGSKIMGELENIYRTIETIGQDPGSINYLKDVTSQIYDKIKDTKYGIPIEDNFVEKFDKEIGKVVSGDMEGVKGKISMQMSTLSYALGKSLQLYVLNILEYCIGVKKVYKKKGKDNVKEEKDAAKNKNNEDKKGKDEEEKSTN